MLKLKDRTILAVTAHPGDLEWYCGGTICQLARENRVVHILAGGGKNGNGQSDEVAAVRREQFAAAEVMGIGETVFLDLPSGDLAYGSLPTLRVRLYRAMRSYQPLVVMSFDPGNTYDPDPDHLALGRLVLEAAALHPNTRLFPEERNGPYLRPELLLFFGDLLTEPSAVNSALEWRDRKIAALRCHTTHTAPALEDGDTASAACGSDRGARDKAPSGEAFRAFAWIDGLLQPMTQSQLAEWRPKRIEPTPQPHSDPAAEERAVSRTSPKDGKLRGVKKGR